MIVYLSLINQKSRDILTNQHKALQDIHDYNNIKKVQDNLVDFALNDLNDFCENIDGEKIKITNPKELNFVTTDLNPNGYVVNVLKNLKIYILRDG